ncbi:MAG TPA: hypothetical protein VG757_14370 [Devosia sp.]|nr:hypothetical protein [Devosia sp.]
MAERKPGPVKPPVIEGVARPAPARPGPAPESAKAEPKSEAVPPAAKPEAKPAPEPKPAPRPEPAKPEAAKPEPTKPEPPKSPPQSGINEPSAPPPPFARRPPEPETNWPLLGGVAVGGAILGTILTYLLANLIALPSHIQQIADPAPQLTAQGERLATLEQQLASLQGSASKTQQSLDATLVQLDSGLAELRQSIEDVRGAIPAPVTVDLSGIEADLKTLKSRVDALSAGVSGGDADAIAQSLSTIDGNIAALTTRLDGVDGRLTAIDATSTALRTDLEAARKLLNDHIASALPNEVGPQLKLPLILSGLETAFASGKPFTIELQSLATVLPDIVVPERLALAAPNGLIRPDALEQKFTALLPEILSARSGSKGNWADDALDWLKSILALRPSGETEGNTPEAIVSRLEGAMDRHDYQAAATLLAALPAEMRNAAGTLGADIAAHADADALLAELRARALAAAGPAP